MDRFEIDVGKNDLYFAAGHFIPFDGGECETLHGHNYRVSATVAGRLTETGWVYDFVSLRDSLVDLIAALDHRMLLPSRHPRLEVVEEEDEVRVRCGARRYVFPRSDVVILPVENTTAELLAAYLADGLADAMGDGVDSVERLELELEESPGQSARCVRMLGRAARDRESTAGG